MFIYSKKIFLYFYVKVIMKCIGWLSVRKGRCVGNWDKIGSL